MKLVEKNFSELPDDCRFLAWDSFRGGHFSEFKKWISLEGKMIIEEFSPYTEWWEIIEDFDFSTVFMFEEK